jgi:cell division protein FtsQ
MRWVALSEGMGIFIGVILGILLWTRDPIRFPVQTIEIQGSLKQIPLDVIRERVSKYATQGFFWLNVEKLQEELSQLPWLSSLSVQRVWPNRLVIQAIERAPLARWGEHELLSTEGEIFYPDVAYKGRELPIFIGTDRQAKEMLQQYLLLLEQLSVSGLHVMQLEWDKQESTKIMLEEGIEIILGKVGIIERLNRCLVTYRFIQSSKRQDITYIDARYPNGVAVGWK